MLTAAAFTAELPCGCVTAFPWRTGDSDSFTRLHGHCLHQDWQLTLTLIPRPSRRFLADNTEPA